MGNETQLSACNHPSLSQTETWSKNAISSHANLKFSKYLIHRLETLTWLFLAWIWSQRQWLQRTQTMTNVQMTKSKITMFLFLQKCNNAEFPSHFFSPNNILCVCIYQCKCTFKWSNTKRSGFNDRNKHSNVSLNIQSAKESKKWIRHKITGIMFLWQFSVN